MSCLGRCDIAPAVAVNEQPAAAAATADLVAAARAGTAGAGRGGTPRAGRPRRPLAQRPLRARRGALPGAAVAAARRPHRGRRRRRPAGGRAARAWAARASRPGASGSWSRRSRPAREYVICNADESEPGHVQGPPDPGGAAAPRARGAAARHGRRRRRGGLGLHPPRVRPRGGRASARRSRSCARRGCSATDVVGSGRRLSVEVFTSPGGYILGEESALIECMEGHRGEPRNKPPFPGTYGLWGRPTLMNSVETLADVPVIVERGAPWWRDQGVGGSTGLKFFAVSGHVARPGVYCVPMGTTVGGLLEAGRRDGRRRRARRGAAGRRLVELPRPRPPRRPARLRDPGGGRVHARVRRHGGDGRGHRPAGRRDQRAARSSATSRAASACPAGSGPPRRTPCSARCWPAGGDLDEGRRARAARAGDGAAPDVDLRPRPGGAGPGGQRPRTRSRWCGGPPPAPELGARGHAGARVLHRPDGRGGTARVPARAAYGGRGGRPGRRAGPGARREDVAAPAALPGFARSTVDGFAVRAADTYGVSDGLPGYLDVVGAVRDGPGPPTSPSGPGTAVAIPTGGALPARRRRRRHGRVHPGGDARHDRGGAARRARRRDGARRRGRGGGRAARAGRATAARPGPGPAGSGGDPGGPASRSGPAWPSSPPATRSCRPTTGVLLPGQVRDATAIALAALVTEAAAARPSCGASSRTTRRRSTGRCGRPCPPATWSSSAPGRRSAPGTRRPASSPASGPPASSATAWRIRPGKPTLLAECDGVPVIGLPGNPLSALVVFRLVGLPVLRLVGGCVSAAARAGHAGAAGPRGAVGRRAPRRRAGPPVPRGRPSRLFGHSALLSVLAAADGYVVVPEAATGPRRRDRGDGDAVSLACGRGSTARSSGTSPPTRRSRRGGVRAPRRGCPERVPAVRVGLADAVGRVTAGAVWASRSSPAFDAAAMDGIAVRRRRHARRERDQPLLLPPEAYDVVDTGDPMPGRP